MNESFITPAVRVAVMFGVVIGLTGFALLLYAVDFWSSPLPPRQDVPAVATQDSEPPSTAAQTMEFAERAVYWMFGPPEDGSGNTK